MRICLDLDDVLNDLSTVWHKHIGINSKDVLYYGWIPDALGYKADDFWRREDTYNYVSPRPGADKLITDIQQLGCSVVILTHTPPGQFHANKMAWINKYFEGIHVIHTDKKYLYTKDALLVDDAPKHVHNHVIEHPYCNGIIYNHEDIFGYSKMLVPDPRITVLNHYFEVLDAVKYLLDNLILHEETDNGLL